MNTLYIEGLGPGGYYSLNYERRIQDFGVRAGFSFMGNDYFKIAAIPMGFNYIGIGGSHSHLELGAAATLAIIDGEGLFGDAVGVIGSAIVGYRFQPPHGGFNFRIGASPIAGAFGFYPWGYISFGGTFGGAKRRSKPQEDVDWYTGDGAEEAEVASAPAAPAAPTAPEATEAEPVRPTGFGGFEFTMSPEAARLVCEESGHTWTESENIGSCDAPAESVGLEGDMQMLRCGNEFCQILLTAEPGEEAIVNEVIALKSALEKQYGPPKVSRSAVPQDCRDTLLECIDTQRAYLEYVWEFEGGEAIKLRLGKKPDPSRAAKDVDHKIRMLYKRPVPAQRDAPEGFEEPARAL